MRQSDFSQPSWGQSARGAERTQFNLITSRYRLEPRLRPDTSDDYWSPRECVEDQIDKRVTQMHRLLALDPHTLSDLEMVELLLSIGNQRFDIKQIAGTLLRRFGTFASILSATTGELIEASGGTASLISVIKFVHASGLRLTKTELKKSPILNQFDRLIDYLNAVIGHETVEVIHLIYVDSRNRVIESENLGRGTVDQVSVYPREIIKRAIHVNATAFIIAHNHLSGDPKPSKDDILMSKKICAAATPLGITFHDHIIIGKGLWLSFRKEGFLKGF